MSEKRHRIKKSYFLLVGSLLFSFSCKNITKVAGYVSSAAGLISAGLAGTAASIGLAASALALFVVINYHIAKTFDNGQGVTLTQEIWGPGIYWFNSGDVVQQ